MNYIILYLKNTKIYFHGNMTYHKPLYMGIFENVLIFDSFSTASQGTLRRGTVS